MKIDELRPGIWRHSAAIFLLTLVLFYLTEPYIEGLEFEKVWRSTTFSLVLVSGALAVGERKKVMVWAGVVSVVAVLLLWVSHLRPDVMPRGYPLALGLLFAIFVSARLLHFILKTPAVDAEVLCAAVATYLMFALACAFLYILVGQADPNAFAWTAVPAPHHRLDNFPALYFSLTTQATLGYGDIVPVSPTARLLVMIQAVGGMFYMTLLVSRLVSVYSTKHKIGNS